MAEPAVSVLLPVRDGEATLPRALASLQRQTLADFEVLCVDDGSADSTPAILERQAARDPRFRLVRQPPLWISAALNRALAESRAPVVVRQDADDVSHPRRLALLLDFLASHPGADVAGSRTRGFPRRAVGVGMERYEAWQNGLLTHEEMRRERFVESPMSQGGAAFRRTALEAAGGWRDDPWPEDLDLWLRLFAEGRRFAKLPETLYFWGEHEARTTRRDPRLGPRAHRACKLHHLQRHFLQERGPVEVWGRGRLLAGWARSLEEAGHPVTAREVDPRRAGRVGALALPGRPRAPLLIALTAPVSRSRLRPALAEAGLAEERDYLFVA